nr:PEP-CTERM sorting domain-containing protein [Paludisphaera mucosa]
MHRMLLAAAVLVAATTAVQADPIVGQLGIGYNGTITATPDSLDSSPLSLSLVPATGGFTTTLAPSGDFGAVAAFSPVTFDGTIDTSSLAGEAISFGTYGSFVAAAGIVAPGATADLVKIILTGTFTPAGALSGFDANTSTLVSLTFQRLPGQGITLSGSVFAPSAVPEPSSVALAGIGLAAAGLFGLRKRLAK